MTNLERLFELQNLMSQVHTYQDLCFWMAESLDNRTVHWPLYHGCNRELGCDSTGGTDPRPYAELCRRGLLTLSSQEGFQGYRPDGLYESQVPYLKLVFPQDYPLDLNRLPLTIVCENPWSILHNGQWLPLADDFRQPLTLINNQVSYEIYKDDTLDNLRKELPDWEGLTGEKFGPGLSADLDGKVVLWLVARTVGPQNIAQIVLDTPN